MLVDVVKDNDGIDCTGAQNIPFGNLLAVPIFKPWAASILHFFPVTRKLDKDGKPKREPFGNNVDLNVIHFSCRFKCIFA